MDSSLVEKVAVITGGAQGVGLGVAQEFSAQGARVVITGLDQAQLASVVKELGPQSSAIMADVSKLAAMEAVFAQVQARYGRLDIVVANAGLNANGPLGTITEAQWDKTFDTNAKGGLFSVQPARSLLQQTGGGCCLVIGSTATLQPPPGMSLSSGSKAAMRSRMRVWIQDIKGSNIRINMLSPGAIDTPSLRQALGAAAGADQVEAAVKQMGEGNPLGRLGQPREIGKAAAFLTSDAASFITGVELFVDGGMAQV